MKLHVLRTLARWYSSKLLPTSTASWILSPKSQRGCPILTRRTASTHTHRRWSELLHGTRDQWSRRRLCAVDTQPRGRRTRRFKSPSGEGAECEESSEAPTTKRDRGLRSVSAKPNSRQRCSLILKISLAGRPRSHWSCSRPDALQFEPCDVGNSCCLTIDWQRYTRLALLLGAGAGISRIRILVKPIRAVPA